MKNFNFLSTLMCFLSFSIKKGTTSFKNSLTYSFLLFFTMLMIGNSSWAQVPDAPTNLVATPVNTGGMIQFIPPVSSGGSAITNYQYSTDNGVSWVTPAPAISASPLIINSGLTNCTSYQVQLRAVNASGTGVASTAVSLNPSHSNIPGIDWLKSSDNFGNIYYSGVTYGNGMFVGVGGLYTGVGGAATSPDGYTWTTSPLRPIITGKV